VAGGDKVRGTAAAEKAIEAARTIRDAGFANLTPGIHGIAIGPSRTWILSGSKTNLSGGYLTSLTITSLSTDWVQVVANSKWKHGVNRSGSVILSAEFTNWRSARGIGNWSTLTLTGSYIDAGTPLFNDIALKGNYAYVSGDTTSGGAGLYIFDITSLTNPTRVGAGFALGANGYRMAIRGSILYIVTSASAGEVRAYDITVPAAPALKATYDLPGSSLATSMALKGNLLFVGATLDPSFAELYSFDVSNSGSIVLRSSLQHTATVNAVAVSGTGVYLATADAASEMKLATFTSTGSLQYPTLTDFNITGSDVARSIAISGTASLLGRQKSAIQEMTLQNTANGPGNPPPSPGPWYHEGSGSVVGIDLDPGECFAFLATDSSIKAVQVADIRNLTLPELTTYNSTSGPGRGLLYDSVRDKLFVVTRKGLLIFQAGSSPGLCQ
jgi:hypothetical protein